MSLQLSDDRNHSHSNDDDDLPPLTAKQSQIAQQKADKLLSLFEEVDDFNDFQKRLASLDLTDDDFVAELANQNLASYVQGLAFGLDVQQALKPFMINYAMQTEAMTATDFGGIVYRESEKLRLEKELNGKLSPFEGIAGDEWQQKFGVELERFDPDVHKVLMHNEKTGTPKSADFAVIDADKAPIEWQTIDFLFTMSEKQASDMAYQIFESKKKRYANAWDNVIETIDEHLSKADIVPMDLRTLDARITTKIIAYVLSLAKEKQKKDCFYCEIN